MTAVNRYDERLRVVRYDDGAAKLAAIREAIDPFPARQQPGSSPLRDVTRPENSPGDGGASLLSDRENPRLRSATGSMPVHRAGQVAGECGDDGGLEPPQGAPLCVRGSNYYLNHEPGSDWRCVFCDWEYPAPTLNGRRG